MLGKSFVSVFFISNKLQLIKLNSRKDKIEVSLTLDIPPDLISNHQVNDSRALAIFIKNAFKKVGIKEKNIAIIIPEFSTFTKLLSLPILGSFDLNEAVRWQMQDILPLKNLDEEAVLDWKVVGFANKEYQIQAVTVQKQILYSFVDAFGNAGLLPILVKTPSLILGRTVENDDEAKLIIYSQYNEVIIVVSSGKKIFATSVILFQDELTIINTISQIYAHFKNNNITKFKIGGLQFSKELLENLQRIFKVKIEWIEFNSVKASPGAIHEYLIPLYLQYLEPLGPESEKTINLLPPKWVSLYQSKHFKIQLWSLAVISSIIIWICLGLTLSYYLLLTSQKNNLSIQKQENNIDLPNDLIRKSAEINKLTEKTIKIASSSAYPQTVINKITKVKIDGIDVTYYNLDLDSGKIAIKGIASNRESLLSFKKSLEGIDEFDSVELPFSVFEAEENIEFDMSLDYLPLAKSKKPIKIQIN